MLEFEVERPTPEDACDSSARKRIDAREGHSGPIRRPAGRAVARKHPASERTTVAWRLYNVLENRLKAQGDWQRHDQANVGGNSDAVV